MLLHSLFFIFLTIVVIFTFTAKSFDLSKSTLQSEIKVLKVSQEEIKNSKKLIYDSALENLEIKD